MKTIFPAVFAGALLMSSAAVAATATGTIRVIDTDERMIELDTGQVFHYDQTENFGTYEIGDEVTVHYTPKGDMLEANHIEPPVIDDDQRETEAYMDSHIENQEEKEPGYREDAPQDDSVYAPDRDKRETEAYMESHIENLEEDEPGYREPAN